MEIEASGLSTTSRLWSTATLTNFGADIKEFFLERNSLKCSTFRQIHVQGTDRFLCEPFNPESYLSRIIMNNRGIRRNTMNKFGSFLLSLRADEYQFHSWPAGKLAVVSRSTSATLTRKNL